MMRHNLGSKNDPMSATEQLKRQLLFFPFAEKKGPVARGLGDGRFAKQDCRPHEGRDAPFLQSRRVYRRRQNCRVHDVEGKRPSLLGLKFPDRSCKIVFANEAAVVIQLEYVLPV